MKEFESVFSFVHELGTWLLPLVSMAFGSAITLVVTWWANRSAFTISREQMKHQLRLAALDRRLQAHQNAYSMCNVLRNNLGAETAQRRNVQDQFVAFWNSDCLYLGPKSRENIRKLYNIYYDFGISGPEPQIGQKLKDMHLKAMEVIAEEVELPPLGSKELLNEVAK
jgi:hypothetical protein